MDAIKHSNPIFTQASTPRLAYRIWELAGLMGVGRSAVYGFIRDRKLRATKVGGITLILASDVEAFLSDCQRVDPDSQRLGGDDTKIPADGCSSKKICDECRRS